jgi:hypothetical protein
MNEIVVPIEWPKSKDFTPRAMQDTFDVMASYCRIAWPGGTASVTQSKGDLPLENRWPSLTYIRDGVAIFSETANWALTDRALSEVAGLCARLRVGVAWFDGKPIVSPPWEMYTVGLLRLFDLPDRPAINLMWELYKAWITRPDNWRKRQAEE